jgi:hypothetical protein
MKKTSPTKPSKIALHLHKETITILRAGDLPMVAGGYPMCPRPYPDPTYVRENCP